MVKQSSLTVEKKHFNSSLYLYTPVAFVAALICFTGCRNEALSAFWILPFAFCILSMITSYTDERLNGLSYNIIKVLMFLRYVLMTAATVTTQYYDGLTLSIESYSTTLYLMLYEMFVVFCVIAYRANKHSNVNIGVAIDDQNTYGALLNLFCIFVVGVTLVVVMMYASARNMLFNFSFTAAEDKRVDATESFIGPAFVFFKIGINVIYALGMIAISKFDKSRGNLSFIIAIIFSVIFISCNWTSGNNVSRWGLVTSMFVCYIVLSKVFPEKKSVLTKVGGFIFLYIILISSITKVMIHHAESTDEAVNDIFNIGYFNEYFQGINPVANGLKVMQARAEDINIITFLDDTISAYPWLNRLFYEAGNITETMYLNYLGTNDKILPTICQGYAHFGYLGAPIFSGFFTYIALRCDESIKKSNSIVSIVALTQIGVWCALFMAVNVFIIQRTTMYFVLLWLVTKVDKMFFGGTQ